MLNKILLVGVLLFVVDVMRGEQKTAAAFKHALAEVLRPANRVVVKRGPWGAEGPDMQVLFDLTDRKAVETLVAHFEPTGDGGYCMCVGDTLVEFRREDEFIMAFTEHHLFRLRSHSAPWSGDLELAGKSNARLWEGFAEIGYDGFIESREEQLRNHAAAGEDWEAFLSLFPENLRPLVPRGLTMEERLESDLGKRLYAEMGDSVLSVRLLWHAMGWLSEESGPRLFYNRNQPMICLWEALNEVSPAVQKAALHSLDDKASEGMVELGAAWHLIMTGQATNWRANISNPQWLELGRVLWRDVATRSSTEMEIVLDAWLNDADALFDPLLLEWLSVQQAPEIEERLLGAETETETESITAIWRPGAVARTALRLGQNGVGDALPVIKRLCDEWARGPDFLALEIAWAKLDPAQLSRIGEPHLTCEVDAVANEALKLIRAEGRELPLQLLTKMAAGSGYVSPASAKGWARAQLAELGLQPLAERQGQRSEISPAEQRAIELLEEGDYEGAVEGYNALTRDPERPLLEIWAALGSGRVDKGFSAASLLVDQVAARRSNDVGIADILIARGMALLAMKQYDEAESDFAAAIRLGTVDSEWCIALAHLAAGMAGDLEQSLLARWQPFRWPGDNESTSNFWPDIALLYLQGKLDASELLASALRPHQEVNDRNRRELSRAHWIIAAQARLKGDVREEREHLAAVLALGDHADGVHVLARLRDRELRWAEEPL